MKLSLNHITSFILASLMMLPLILPLISQIQQRYHQWEMLEQLEQQELVTIEAKASEIQWIKKGKECLVHGVLFDVKSYDHTNGKYLLTGLYDDQEKALLKKLVRQTEERQKNGHPAQFIKLLFSNLMLPAVLEPMPPMCFVSKTQASYLNSLHSDPAASVSSPPPEQI